VQMKLSVIRFIL